MTTVWVKDEDKMKLPTFLLNIMRVLCERVDDHVNQRISRKYLYSFLQVSQTKFSCLVTKKKIKKIINFLTLDGIWLLMKKNHWMVLEVPNCWFRWIFWFDCSKRASFKFWKCSWIFWRVWVDLICFKFRNIGS